MNKAGLAVYDVHSCLVWCMIFFMHIRHCHKLERDLLPSSPQLEFFPSAPINISPCRAPFTSRACSDDSLPLCYAGYG